ncbi:MAG: hypothetical protein QXT73_01160 [Candidatus Methanomethylicaceae archaeon]
MTTAACGYKKHTPIVSEAQRGLFGAELARRRAGKSPKMKGITTKELIAHLKESKGKDLPERIKKGRGHWPNERQSAGGSCTVVSSKEMLSVNVRS